MDVRIPLGSEIVQK